MLVFIKVKQEQACACHLVSHTCSTKVTWDYLFRLFRLKVFSERVHGSKCLPGNAVDLCMLLMWNLGKITVV